MATLTIALIVKNEASNLAACLTSCEGLADEIVVVDSGSTDDTIGIAKQFGALVIENPEWKGFGAQRRFAQQHCKSDWILWIDADERLTPELKVSIAQVVQGEQASDCVYSVGRLSWVFGRFIRHSGWYPDRVVRLYRRTLTQYSDAPVHESVIVPPGIKILPINGDLLHYTYRDLEHYLVKSAQYAALWAKHRAENGKRSSIMQGMLHGIGCFLRMYVLKVGFLDGKQGFLLAVLSAHSTFVKYADLWIRHQSGCDK